MAACINVNFLIQMTVLWLKGKENTRRIWSIRWPDCSHGSKKKKLYLKFSPFWGSFFQLSVDHVFTIHFYATTKYCPSSVASILLLYMGTSHFLSSRSLSSEVSLHLWYGIWQGLTGTVKRGNVLLKAATVFLLHLTPD